MPNRGIYGNFPVGADCIVSQTGRPARVIAHKGGWAAIELTDGPWWSRTETVNVRFTELERASPPAAKSFVSFLPFMWLLLAAGIGLVGGWPAVSRLQFWVAAALVAEVFVLSAAESIVKAVGETWTTAAATLLWLPGYLMMLPVTLWYIVAAWLWVEPYRLRKDKVRTKLAGPNFRGVHHDCRKPNQVVARLSAQAYGVHNRHLAYFPDTLFGNLAAARLVDQKFISVFGFWANPPNMWRRFFTLCFVFEWWALREIVDINAYVLFRFVVVYCWSLIFVLAAASFVDCADGGGWLVRLDLA
mmetsp:Transcript_26268/g.78771  ORF Transcript_26268/g.78771 Transcript_26268/m.78771 type:complete len:302 (+) Transcript_26268:104-1009(+)